MSLDSPRSTTKFQAALAGPFSSAHLPILVLSKVYLQATGTRSTTTLDLDCSGMDNIAAAMSHLGVEVLNRKI